MYCVGQKVHPGFSITSYGQPSIRMDGWLDRGKSSVYSPTPPPPLMRWERNLDWYPRPRHPRVLRMGLPVQPVPRPWFSLAVSSSPCLSRSSCGIPHSCDRPGVSIWAPTTAETTPSFPLRELAR